MPMKWPKFLQNQPNHKPLKNTIRVHLIVNVHLDLATNDMTLNRDLTRTVHEIREKEHRMGWNDYQDRVRGTVALPELREGNVGLVLATMISRYSEIGCPLHTMALRGWHSERLIMKSGPRKNYSFGDPSTKSVIHK